MEVDESKFESPDFHTPIIEIRDVSERKHPIFVTGETDLFTPGQEVTRETGLMRGHGTYQDQDVIRTSVSGVLEKVNKLIIVKPIKCRYTGNIGDVVVGRVTEIQQKRWKVDINYRLDASLLLSSINLPGGELRQRSEEDERKMRTYFNEGDLISAEVQTIYSDGSIFLHTRSLKYGKLTNGILLYVYPTLIKRCKTHFLNICGLSVILGNNGLIWIHRSSGEDNMGGFTKNLALEIDEKDAEALIRLKCCILALSRSRLLIYEQVLINAVAVSQKYLIHELCKPDVMLDIAQETMQSLANDATSGFYN